MRKQFLNGEGLETTQLVSVKAGSEPRISDPQLRTLAGIPYCIKFISKFVYFKLWLTWVSVYTSVLLEIHLVFSQPKRESSLGHAMWNSSLEYLSSH